MEIEVDFDVAITGFEMPEIDVLIDGLEARPAKADPADVVPAIAGPAVTRLGDVWQIGPHRLICGDATTAETYARLLDGERAQLVFTDPPYNVRIDGHVSGPGVVQHREFASCRKRACDATAVGEMTEAAFTAFLGAVFGHLVASTADGAIHFVCMDGRHQGEVLATARGRYELKNLCV